MPIFRFSSLVCLASTLLLGAACATPGNADEEASNGEKIREDTDTAQPSLWVMGYYTAASYNKGFTPDKIDMRALTHVAHFSVVPKADGTLVTDEYGFTLQGSRDIIAAGHASGVKVLVTVGGGGYGEAFIAAIKPATRAKLVSNIVALAASRGYDGVDVDFEPNEPIERDDFIHFIKDLREAMRASNPRALLTTAVMKQPAIFVELEDQFDQINVMTYDQGNTWEGFDSWHNSSLYSFTNFASGPPAPSAHDRLAAFQNAGIARRKLGLGIPSTGASGGA